MKSQAVAGLIVAGLFMACSQFVVAGDDDERGKYRGRSERSESYGNSENRSSSMSRGKDVAAVDNQKYATECGSCHFAYQPGLLPERSWRKLMDGLNDHFGENAELPDADRKELTDYLANNAADHVNYKRSVRLNDSITKGDTPLRITKVPYFAREHREVGNRIKGNDKVKSLSQCELCHQNAANGSYEEGEINVPGIGRWED